MDSAVVEHIVRLLLGCVVLFAGRNLFWLFIAIIGFLVGIEFAEVWVVDQPAWMVITVALAAGIIGAILAVVVKRLAFALAGFFAASFLAVGIAEQLGAADVPAAMIFASGIAGAFLAALLTDWMIIVLSALVGASAIMSVFGATPGVEALGVVGLATMGVWVQGRILTRYRYTRNEMDS